MGHHIGHPGRPSPGRSRRARGADRLDDREEGKAVPERRLRERPRLLRARHQPRLPQGQVPPGRAEDVGRLLGREEVPGQPIHDNNAVRAAQFALVADGVPPDKVFPMDVDRAFKKLDQIKPHIKVWWTQGNQSQQLLRDGEVDMMVMWNARASELRSRGIRSSWCGTGRPSPPRCGASRRARPTGRRPGSSCSSPSRPSPRPTSRIGSTTARPIRRRSSSSPRGRATAADLQRERQGHDSARHGVGSGAHRQDPGALHAVAGGLSQATAPATELGVRRLAPRSPRGVAAARPPEPRADAALRRAHRLHARH